MAEDLVAKKARDDLDPVSAWTTIETCEQVDCPEHPAACTRCGHVHFDLWGVPTDGYCNHLSMSGGPSGMQQRCPCNSLRLDPALPAPVDGTPEERALVFAANKAPDPYAEL